MHKFAGSLVTTGIVGIVTKVTSFFFAGGFKSRLPSKSMRNIRFQFFHLDRVVLEKAVNEGTAFLGSIFMFWVTDAVELRVHHDWKSLEDSKIQGA